MNYHFFYVRLDMFCSRGLSLDSIVQFRHPFHSCAFSSYCCRFTGDTMLGSIQVLIKEMIDN